MISRPQTRVYPPASPAAPLTLDSKTAERVRQWVTRWHGADYEVEDITHMLEDWPGEVPLADLLEPFGRIPESSSSVELSRLAMELIRHVEWGRLHAEQARGVFRLACKQLCLRGIPFEETAKGDETALWFHFIGMNEFGDAENQGYATDFSELRLMSRYLLDREELLNGLLDGEFPQMYSDGHVSIAGALSDPQLSPYLLRILRRSEDVQQVATVIHVLGRLGDRAVVSHLRGYALSTSEEIAITAVIALESLGGDEAEEILLEVESVISDYDTPLAAHVAFALLNLREGPEEMRARVFETAADDTAPTVARLAAIERLGFASDRDTVQLLASLLDDPTFERVRIDGLLTDDVIYSVREAAYLALIDRRINTLVEILGEDILDRLESFQMYSVPSWWDPTDRRENLAG